MRRRFFRGHKSPGGIVTESQVITQHQFAQVNQLQPGFEAALAMSPSKKILRLMVPLARELAVMMEFKPEDDGSNYVPKIVE